MILQKNKLKQSLKHLISSCGLDISKLSNKEFKEIDTRIIAIELLSIFQGINWFCLFHEDKALAKKYLKKSIEVILDGIKKRS